MKRGTFGVIVLLALFAGSFTAMNTVRSQLSPVISRMELASRAAGEGDLQKTAALTEEARAAWETYRLKFSCLSPQESVREIDSLYERVRVYGEAEEPAHCRETCTILKNRLEALLEDQLLTLKNLL